MLSCKDCLDRWINLEEGRRCHDTCNTYLEFVEERRIIKKKVYEESLAPRYDRAHGDNRSLSNAKKRNKKSIFDTVVRKR
jgi:hypothetical protein